LKPAYPACDWQLTSTDLVQAAHAGDVERGYRRR